MFFHVGQVIVDLKAGKILRVLEVSEGEQVITRHFEIDFVTVSRPNTISSDVTIVTELHPGQISSYRFWRH